MDWRAISSDPNDANAISAVARFFNGIAKTFTGSKIQLICNECNGKSMLDIGAAGHVITQSIEEWPHEIFRRYSSKVVAIEIDKQSCDYYNSKGYDFRCLDATSKDDIGENFDFIYCGDIIEHVNDPVALMKFVNRHMHPGGYCYISTPNPYFSGFRQLAKSRNELFYTPNLQHISWIVPANMLEIIRRANHALFFHSIFIPDIAQQMMVSYGGPIEEYFHEYIYVIGKKR